MVHKQHELTQVIQGLGFTVRALADQVKSLRGGHEEKDRLLTETAAKLADAVARCELLLRELLKEQDRRNDLVARLQAEVGIATRLWQESESRKEKERGQDRLDALRWREHVAQERMDAERVYYEQQDIAALWDPIRAITDTVACLDCAGEYLVPGRDNLIHCHYCGSVFRLVFPPRLLEA